MSRPGTPQKNDSSLLMRTRKSHQDFRILAAESLARNESVYTTDPSFQETHGLLSQVIEMGDVDDGYHNKLKEPQKWYKKVSMVKHEH